MMTKGFVSFLVGTAALAVGACESAPPPRAPDAEGKASGASQHSVKVVPFGAEGAPTRPERIQGEQPGCTSEAIERRAEGQVVAVCILTVEGILEQCRMAKDTAGLGDEVLRVLPSWRFKPARQGGEPIQIKFWAPFTFRCKPPLP